LGVLLGRAKNLVGNVLSICLRAPISLAWRIQGKKSPGKCVVLYYHAIPPNRTEVFKRQIDELLRMARPISAAETASLEPGNRYFAITFDDAFVSVLEEAIPVLAVRNIPCIIFVPTGYLGRSPAWKHERHFRERDEVVATAEQLCGLPRDLVTIGSHTVMHLDLENLDDETVEKELRESKEQLEKSLGRDVHLLAFPYGHVTPSLVEWARTVGYTRVFGTQPNACCLRQNCFEVGRINANLDDGIWEFRLKVYAAFCHIPAMTMLKNKLKSLLGVSRSSDKVRQTSGITDNHD
jgi:peptidoglycan/xylan/chitin deacetylase (PgdA/CDA1 family)